MSNDKVQMPNQIQKHNNAKAQMPNFKSMSKLKCQNVEEKENNLSFRFRILFDICYLDFGFLL
jgi:hypothetical protein